MKILNLENLIVSLIVTTVQADENGILNDLRQIQDWANSNLGNFEIIIVSDRSLSISDVEKSKFVSNLEGLIWINLGSISNREVQVTAGLDSAIGDITMEVRGSIDSIATLNALQHAWDENFHDEVIVFRNRRASFLNWVLSKFSGNAVMASECGPRLVSRDALQPWITRNDRHKAVRLAHHLSGREIAYVFYEDDPRCRDTRVIRESIRSVVHVTPIPLRWAAFLGIVGSLLSLTWAVSVLALGLRRDVVEGWTTTNLQISVQFFISSLVLSILAEYVYQISAASSHSLPYRVRTELTSPIFPLRNIANVEVMRFVDDRDV